MPPAAEREKLADQLMDRIVKERDSDPMAWLIQLNTVEVRKSKQGIYRTSRAGLAKALELIEKQPQNVAAGVPVLLAAAARAQTRGNIPRQTEFSSRAVGICAVRLPRHLTLLT